MRKIRIRYVVICLLLVCAMAVNLTGCVLEAHAMDLMKGITPQNVTALEDLDAQRAEVIDFAIRLFQTSNESGKNTLISPLSVLYALAMTANGAEKEEADFGGMGTSEGNIYISRVLHKAYISVGENGAKAGAATAMVLEDCAIVDPQLKEVNLDRPFVYMLVDCENNIPFFIGTMMDGN